MLRDRSKMSAFNRCDFFFKHFLRKHFSLLLMTFEKDISPNIVTDITVLYAHDLQWNYFQLIFLSVLFLFQIVGLYGKCSRYMQARLTIHNAVEVYVFAKTICCTELQNDALSVTTRRFSDILATESFLNLRKDDLVDIISSDELGVGKRFTM